MNRFLISLLRLSDSARNILTSRARRCLSYDVLLSECAASKSSIKDSLVCQICSMRGKLLHRPCSLS
ncbi:hypothetical protein KP509_17G004000 [Ceratopteris richardii]|uniref:Uncharacterized protein n=1 Tax=Ceratopteris richardii TaxID=49495 RepID=A0A8T2SRS2_CERRI|nr:hypothetical protein KP509_17G004000 [Ceratopteris richardii]